MGAQGWLKESSSQGGVCGYVCVWGGFCLRVEDPQW